MRESRFWKIKEEMQEGSVGKRNLCPTRWNVWEDALPSILINYKYLFKLWEWSIENLTDTDMEVRAFGVRSCMRSFELYFVCKLGVLSMSHTDNLSNAFQNPKLTAINVQELASTTIQSLKNYHTDYYYYYYSFISVWLYKK